MKNFDKIEDYLFGKTTEEARRAFEAEAQSDADLAAELALQKLEHQAMELAAQREMRSKLADWKREKEAANESAESETKPTFSIVYRRFFQYAAAASVALAVGFWLFSGPSGAGTAADLFDQTSIARERSGGEKDPLEQGVDLLQAKKWADAEAALAPVADRWDAKILIGECLFRQKKWAEAAAHFQKMNAEPTARPEEKAQAEWFLSLVYLAEGGKKDARFLALFQKMLGNPDHGFHPKAKELKAQLD